MLKKTLKNSRLLIIILSVCIFALTFIFTFNFFKEPKIRVGKYPQEEVSVDLGDSKCLFLKKKSLLNQAKSVYVTYEEKDKVVGFDATTGYDITSNVFIVKLHNLTNKFRVEVYNDYTNETIELEDDTFETFYTNDIITYTINLYVKNAKCSGELYRSFKIATPVENMYYDLPECNNHKDFKYCQKFIQESQLSLPEFYEKIKEIEEK